VRKKATMEWDQFKEIVKKQPKVKKLPLVKFDYEQLLKILEISTSNKGNIPKNAFSRMEKDEDLGDVIIQCKLSDVKKTRVLGANEFNKTT
jgi:hypothetical protein